MFTKIFGGLVLSAGLLFTGITGFSEAEPKQRDCCAKQLACCEKKLACCAAPQKLGCCAKGMKCCEGPSACCAAPQECCRIGAECCDEAKACCGPTVNADAASDQTGLDCVGGVCAIPAKAAATASCCAGK